MSGSKKHEQPLPTYFSDLRPKPPILTRADSNASISSSVLSNASSWRIYFAIAWFFFVEGASMGNWAASLPMVKEKHHINDAVLGDILFAAAAGSLLAMPIVSYLIEIFGSGRITLIGSFMMSIVFPFIGIADNLEMVILGAFFLGFGLLTLNSAMNCQAVLLESESESASCMGLLHAVYPIGGLIGALVGGILFDLGCSLSSEYILFGIILLLPDIYFAMTLYDLEEEKEINFEKESSASASSNRSNRSNSNGSCASSTASTSPSVTSYGTNRGKDGRKSKLTVEIKVAAKEGESNVNERTRLVSRSAESFTTSETSLEESSPEQVDRKRIQDSSSAASSLSKDKKPSDAVGDIEMANLNQQWNSYQAMDRISEEASSDIEHDNSLLALAVTCSSSDDVNPPVVIDYYSMMIVCTILFLGYFVEGCIDNWSVIYLGNNWKISILVSTLGFISFQSSLAIGRVFYSQIYTFCGGRKRLLIASGIITALGLFISVIASLLPSSPYLLFLAIFGFFFSGIGLGVLSPTIVSLVGEGIDGFSANSSMSLATAIGYFGTLISPILCGNFAELSGSLTWSFAVLSGFTLIISVIVLALPSKRPTVSDNKDDGGQSIGVKVDLTPINLPHEYFPL